MNINLKKTFEWFHRHPELSYAEVATTEKIEEILQKEKIEILKTNLKTGTVAIIRGALAGETICLRSDIDALPISEKTALPYASEHDGVMHACGHDFHITVVLETAILLQEQKEKLHGDVLVVFQPAEEAPGGALDVLSCAPEFASVSAYFGIHVAPGLPVDSLGITPGGVMASVDRFQITITGSGTHAAAPHLENNPIPVLASLARDIQLLAAKEVNPLHPHVVSVTHVKAGTSWNVIPDTAFLEGTVRCFDPEDRASIRETICKMTQSECDAHDMTSHVEWYEGPGSIYNDEMLCRYAQQAAAETDLLAVKMEPSMISDDFSFYLRDQVHSRDVRGLYIRIGTGDGLPLHHPQFQVDEKALIKTPKFLAHLLLSYSAKEISSK